MKFLKTIFAISGILYVGAAFAQSPPSSFIGQSGPAAGNSPKAPSEAMPELYSPDALPNAHTLEVITSPPVDRATSNTRGPHDAEIYKTLSPSVVMIMTKEGLGSGSLLGDNKILTNYHVVKGYQQVQVVFKPLIEGDTTTPPIVAVGDVVRVNPATDLALVQIPSTPPQFRSMALGSDADIQIGADVHAIGHPHGYVWTYTKGFISQFRKDYVWAYDDKIPHKGDVIQTQTPISPGNSGGPLISDEGKLIGVNSFGSSGELLNFSVAISEVRKFLAAAPVASNTGSAIAQPPVATTPVSACKPKVLYEGRDQTEKADIALIDTNCDGKADFSLVKWDDTTKPIYALIDSNYDGKIDISVEDRQRNGHWDISYHDIDFNGTIDLIGRHPDGKITASSYEKYVGPVATLK